MKLRFLVPGFLLIVSLTAVSCGKKIPVLPEGVQAIKGELSAVPLSLVRRGTHVLTLNGQKSYYVESSAINLRPYEGTVVEIRGTLELNTDPKDLPVIVVEAITNGADLPMKTWNIKVMDISVGVPQTWNAEMEQDMTSFTLSGSVQPILAVFFEKAEQLNSVAQTGSTVSITPTEVNGKDAMRIVNHKTGRERIQIDLGDDVKGPGKEILTLLFIPQDEEMGKSSSWVVLKNIVLLSVTFSGESVSSKPGTASGSYPTSGTGTGIPCGGPAGILCPQGQYCEVTDWENDIGRCKPL